MNKEEKYNMFLEWLSNKLQVSITKQNRIGGGADGEVHDIGNGRVIKLTSSNIKESYKLINKNIDGLCKIYSIGELRIPKRFVTKIRHRYFLELQVNGLGLSTPEFSTYYIIMEKLDSKKAQSDLDFYIDGVIDSFLDYDDKYGKYDYETKRMNSLYTLNQHRDNNEFLEELIMYANNSYFQKNSEVDKFYDLLSDLLKIFKNVSKYFKWVDIHVGQFGYDKKMNLKAFDIDSQLNVELDYDFSKSKHVVMENVMTFEQYKSTENKKSDEQIWEEFKQKMLKYHLGDNVINEIETLNIIDNSVRD